MKVVISGYYGFGNAGDEAILEAMLGDLQAVAPRVRPIVLSGDPNETAARFGVEAVSRLRWREVHRAFRGAALFISGGGSLLQDATGWGSVPYYAGLMLAARWFRVPVFVYAQGIGPLRRPWLRALAGRVISVADEVTVRDRASYDMLRQLGVDPRRMSVTADPVFGLVDSGNSVFGLVNSGNSGFGPVNSGDSTFGLVNSADSTFSLVNSGDSGFRAVNKSWFGAERARPLIGVSLRPLPGGDESDADAIVDAVAAALRPRLEQWDADVAPLPLHAVSDRPVLDRLGRALGERMVEWPSEIEAGKLTARDWMNLIAGLDLCVTMRLHGLIFAAGAGTPFVALSDDPKVAAHVEELGLDGDSCLVPPAALVSGATGELSRDRQVEPMSTVARNGENGQRGMRESELGEVLDRVWHARNALRAQLRAAVPALADRARLTAVRAIRLAESRADQI